MKPSVYIFLLFLQFRKWKWNTQKYHFRFIEGDQARSLPVSLFIYEVWRYFSSHNSVRLGLKGCTVYHIYIIYYECDDRHDVLLRAAVSISLGLQ